MNDELKRTSEESVLPYFKKALTQCLPADVEEDH